MKKDERKDYGKDKGNGQKVMGVCYNAKGHHHPEQAVSLSPGDTCTQCGEKVSHTVVIPPSI